MTPSQVVAEHPHLTMAQIHAALAYYWTHRDEIHREIEESERIANGLISKSGPSKFRERRADEDAANDSLPLG